MQFIVPRYFTYDPPVSPRTIAEWQRDLDQLVYRGPGISHLVIRWEPGDPWQPIGRFLLWQCVDPSYVCVEPWNIAAVRGPSPRSTGHYCADGWCLCEVKRNRWVAGASRLIDKETWRLYRETGLWGQRWWTIQGSNGGHRYQWAKDELATHVSVAKGGPADTPRPGDLPYAPFDGRVARQILTERRLAAVEMSLKGCEMAALSIEDQEEAKAKAKALWQVMDDRVEDLWNNHEADRLPRYFEETYGRAPSGTRQTLDPEYVERRFAESF